jgi:hypothetical protein
MAAKTTKNQLKFSPNEWNYCCWISGNIIL